MVTAADATLHTPIKTGRIEGLDLARAAAMFGMVVVHYVATDGTEGTLGTIAEAMVGRAMPLFMMLGGVGVHLATRRSAHPDRDLLVRAVLLLLLGMVVHELTARIAIVLQSYGLFFALAPLFRRLPRPLLLVGAAITTAVGAVTYQQFIPPPLFTTFGDLADPSRLAQSLFVSGYYPFFPVVGFFLVGIWIGGLDLRSDRVAATLAGIGTAVGLGVMVVANAIVDSQELLVSRFDGDDVFRAANLLNTEGHSEMPAWVLSAGGTSAAVIGICLLLAPRVQPWLSPVLALGTLALTFYIFQAIVIHLAPPLSETTITEEFRLVLILYIGFLPFAWGWKYFFRSGPFESLLRLGPPRRR